MATKTTKAKKTAKVDEVQAVGERVGANWTEAKGRWAEDSLALLLAGLDAGLTLQDMQDILMVHLDKLPEQHRRYVAWRAAAPNTRPDISDDPDSLH